MPLLWWFGEFLFSRNFLYPKPEVRGLRSEEVQGPRPRRERPVTARGLCHTRSAQTIHSTQMVNYSPCATHNFFMMTNPVMMSRTSSHQIFDEKKFCSSAPSRKTGILRHGRMQCLCFKSCASLCSPLELIYLFCLTAGD